MPMSSSSNIGGGEADRELDSLPEHVADESVDVIEPGDASIDSL